MSDFGQYVADVQADRKRASQYYRKWLGPETAESLRDYRIKTGAVEDVSDSMDASVRNAARVQELRQL